jgi:hypothetical protein
VTETTNYFIKNIVAQYQVERWDEEQEVEIIEPQKIL